MSKATKRSTTSAKEKAKAKKARSVDDLKDEKTGKKRWSLFKDEAEKAAKDAAGLPSSDVFETADLCLGIHLNVFEPEKKGTMKRLSAADRKDFEAAFKRIVGLDQALYFAASRYSVIDVPLWQKPGMPELVAEGMALAAKGKAWLRPLVLLGAITAEEAGRITAGTGRPDMIQDLINLGVVLDEDWTLIKHMLRIPKQEGETLLPKITKRDVSRMSELGTDLREKLEADGSDEPKGEVDWRKQVIGLFALLERDYDTVRDYVGLHLRRSGRRAEADALVSLRGLTRFGKTRATKTEPKPSPEPATDSTPGA
jgi:hypothetical protein